MHSTSVILRYPKGRLHDETVTTQLPLDVGSEFGLYGHTWKVVAVMFPRSRYDEHKTRLVCELADLPVAA
jgi:hypothetical protein